MKFPNFRVSGVVAAPLTAFKANGDINPDAVGQYVDYLVNNHVNGVFLLGTMGEGMSLTTEERKRVAEAWVTAGKGKLNSIIVHIGTANIRDSMELNEVYGQNNETKQIIHAGYAETCVYLGSTRSVAERHSNCLCLPLLLQTQGRRGTGDLHGTGGCRSSRHSLLLLRHQLHLWRLPERLAVFGPGQGSHSHSGGAEVFLARAARPLRLQGDAGRPLPHHDWHGRAIPGSAVSGRGGASAQQLPGRHLSTPEGRLRQGRSGDCQEGAGCGPEIDSDARKTRRRAGCCEGDDANAGDRRGPCSPASHPPHPRAGCGVSEGPDGSGLFQVKRFRLGDEDGASLCILGCSLVSGFPGDTCNVILFLSLSYQKLQRLNYLSSHFPML